MKKISLVIILAAFYLTACSTMYYETMENFGVYKRDIMIDRVEEARDVQLESKEQFKSALERFSAVLGFDGGELEEKYEQLNEEYENSKELADEVSERIEAVEDVAEDMFAEWEDELDQYSNQKLRRSSERKLSQTKSQYKRLITAMKKAESRMQPVLATLHDQVLYLKHNLNAKAIASLKTELNSIKTDVSHLITEMEKSIKEANTFIDQMGE